ncbi:MAG: hypothetical protein WBD20_06455 [Pirellulaceae bacterium]
MNCQTLAQRISELQPELAAGDVARLCLLILSSAADIDALADDDVLMKAWRNASFRLEAATDQHAAVSVELDEMCSGGPVQFTPDQLWILLRAVKVQSQILELYTNEPVLMK